MELVKQALAQHATLPTRTVIILTDRLTLAKRRWRAVADDGREFGFDLEHALGDGDAVFADEAAVYRLSQQPEWVLSMALEDAAGAARLGWLLGNLHFRIAVSGETVQVPDDPAVRQLLEREHIHFHQIEAVFRPAGGGHSHGHTRGH